MKTYLNKNLLLLLLITISGLSNAQNKQLGGPRKDNIESMKIGFFTNQMQLTPDEATKFWPLYNQYQKSLEEQKIDRRKVLRDANEMLDTMSDDDINKLIDSRLQQAKIALNEREEFVSGIRRVLPPKKVALYFKAEEMFKRKLMERMNERDPKNHLNAEE